jgi:hypothetical protein
MLTHKLLWDYGRLPRPRRAAPPPGLLAGLAALLARLRGAPAQ